VIKAVIWDFGGVFTTSPFAAFSRYEHDNGIPVGFIRSVNATNPDSNAWAQFESSRLSLGEFDVLFAEETEAAGYRIPGMAVIELLSGDIRPQMVDALGRIKQHYRVACITNNVKGAGQGPGMANGDAKALAVMEIMAQFDFVIESSVVGFRKPDPRIYQLACEQLDIDASEALFIDDLGVNLKPARAMGMTTIKVLSLEQALADLSAVLSMDLVGDAA